MLALHEDPYVGIHPEQRLVGERLRGGLSSLIAVCERSEQKKNMAAIALEQHAYISCGGDKQRKGGGKEKEAHDHDPGDGQGEDINNNTEGDEEGGSAPPRLGAFVHTLGRESGAPTTWLVKTEFVVSFTEHALVLVEVKSGGVGGGGGEGASYTRVPASRGTGNGDYSIVEVDAEVSRVLVLHPPPPPPSTPLLPLLPLCLRPSSDPATQCAVDETSKKDVVKKNRESASPFLKGLENVLGDRFTRSMKGFVPEFE